MYEVLWKPMSEACWDALNGGNMPRSTAAHINRLPPPAVEVTVGLCVHLEPGQVSLIHVEALSLVYAEI